MKLGFIGLGKMGSRMVFKLLQEGHDVMVWNRSQAPIEELEFKIQNSKVKIKSQNLKVSESIQNLVESLEKPRVIWLMLPAGDVTQNILDQIAQYAQKGDIIVDGGNAHFSDTERRSKEFGAKNIEFLGVGVSGGLLAFENGYPIMVGGSKNAYEKVRPIFDSLAKPNGGYEYFGEGGAGHFVKMVHNGIEYGIMQSIGEGFGVLQKSSYAFDLAKVASLWQKGTIVSGFLIDRTKEVLEKDQLLSNVEGIIAESGEAKWTIEEAKKENSPVPVIEKSLEFRQQSQTNTIIQQSFAAKLIAALRNVFGGHEVRKK